MAYIISHKKGRCPLFPKRIDLEEIDEEIIISGITATHELGHAIAFHNQISQKTIGHFSGPGLMWSVQGMPCTVLSRKNGRRMSYFWGDHVFVMRFDPEI
ncbi:hypothetical protein J7L05_06725 [bacterium]|nr:hypothetical protein [bacterium]